MANILVIDDDPDLRQLMRVSLGRFGHQVTVALRGEEGLELARAGGFDLVVVDVMMPDIDGYEVTRRLRTDPATRSLPILFLSARNQAADHASALEAGADEYATKPFDPATFGAKLNQLLAGAAHRAGAALSPGEVSVVLGLAGGAGATTCAVNLAGALARVGRRVCVVDLSPSSGHVALHLRVATPTTWADLPAYPDAAAVGKVLTRHESGIVVLASPMLPTHAGPRGYTVRDVLDILRNYFTDIVVDAAPVLDEATCAALAVAQNVLVMCRFELGAVQTTVGTLQVLPGLVQPETKVRLVVNCASSEAGLPAAALERALGRQPDLLLPYDRQQAGAVSRGVPLILSDGRSPLADAMRGYVARLLEPA